jgi:hypothetical protein
MMAFSSWLYCKLGGCISADGVDDNGNEGGGRDGNHVHTERELSKSLI